LAPVGYREQRVTELTVDPAPDSPDPDEPVPPVAAHDPVDDDGDDTGDGTDEDNRLLSPAARAFFDWVLVVGIALFVAIIVRTFVLAHYQVEGNSMFATLHPGDRVFVNKLSYRLHDPNRGDVVVLHELGGANGERDLIKRVIALPGETIEIDNCDVYIDADGVGPEPAVRLDEPYLDPSVTASRGWCDYGPTDVPAGHVFVMGDNRDHSSDSRQIGPIAEDDLVGRAFVVFWPKSDWQWL
jgi:signal peptidase I